VCIYKKIASTLDNLFPSNCLMVAKEANKLAEKVLQARQHVLPDYRASAAERAALQRDFAQYLVEASKQKEMTVAELTQKISLAIAYMAVHRGNDDFSWQEQLFSPNLLTILDRNLETLFLKAKRLKEKREREKMAGTRRGRGPGEPRLLGEALKEMQKGGSVK